MTKLDKKRDELADEFKEAAEPLIKFLNDRCNPHTQVIVTTNSAELVSGELVFNTEEFIHD